MPFQPQQTVHRAAGFSIVELLVSAALTLLLTGGVVAVFMGSRTTQAANERFAQIQETGRRALDLIARDIRAAGYSGCVSRPRYMSSSLHDSQLDLWRLSDAPVRGYEIAPGEKWNAQAAHEMVTPAASASDVLLLRRPVPNARTLRLKRDMADDTNPLFVGDTSNANWHVGDVVLAHSCEAHAYFAVSGLEAAVVRHDRESGNDDPIAAARLNSTGSLGYAFRAGAELTPVESTVYYVGSRTEAAPTGSGLWRRAGNKRAEEVAAGVEQMQVQFGVDLDGDAAVDSYVDADAVERWSTVRSVSVVLVVLALNRSASGTATHRPSGESAGENGESTRRTFSTVVTLRNYFGDTQ